MEIKKIKAKCPVCLASAEDILYHNAGPIIKIYCKNCGKVCSEDEAKANGFSDIIDYWNSIGVDNV